MSSKDKHKPSRNMDFWRACRYFYPHRKLVITSLLCAFVVGAAFTSGLGTMLPILRVLFEGDTLQGWASRKVVEKRLDISIDDREVKQVLVLKTSTNGAGAGVGLKIGNVLTMDGTEDAGRTLEAIADPDRDNVTLSVLENEGASRRTVEVSLPKVSWHLAMLYRGTQLLPRDPVWAIASVFGILAFLGLFGNFVRFFQEYFADKAAILATEDIRRHLYDHVLHLPLGYFGAKGTSDITSRIVQDTGNLQEGFKNILGKTIQEPIKAAMSLGLALYFSWKLTLFLVLFAPIMVVMIQKFGKKMRRASRKALQNASSMLGQLEGTLIGIRVVKASSAERFERRRYRVIMRDLVNQMLRMSRLDSMSAPIIESLMLLVVGAVVLYASHLVLKPDPELSPLDFMMVMGGMAGMQDSLRRVSKLNNALQRSNAAAARIFEAMELPVERPRRNTGERIRRKQLVPLANEIRFENVSFTYLNASQSALDEVNLVVPKGQSVAIVGRNGSGKTTLLAILARFFEPQSGAVLIDGVDIRSVTLRSLREQIAIVTQDAVVFPGTLAQNIAYGHPLAGHLSKDTPDIRAVRIRIEAAAKAGFAHDFIMEKANGYDTVIGEHGAQLSGGQRQRLCIARAIFRDAPILILDEATSQVDSESEHLIQQAIDEIRKHRTVFIIAHRFSTIQSVDRVVVMDRGRIVAVGQHHELMRTCPIYEQLYDRQILKAVSSTEAAEAPAA